MKHETEIVAYRKVSNGKFAVCIRCCGNAGTDSWHTMASKVLASPKARKESIKNARARVAKEHEDAFKAEEASIELMSTKEEHE